MEDKTTNQTDNAGRSNGVALTPASVVTAARARQMTHESEERAQGLSFLVTALATFFSLVWPMSVFAFPLGVLGLENFLALPAHWWAALIGGAFFPIPIFWLTAIVLSRSYHLTREANRLSEMATKFTEPEHTAARQIATIGLAVRREVEGLNAGIESALDRIQTLEAAVAYQTEAIDHAATKAESESKLVREKIERERDKLLKLSQDIQTQTTELIGRIAEQADQFDDAQKKFQTASETLQQKSRDFSTTAKEALDNTAEAGKELERQSAKLETISDAALSRADVIAGRYDKQREAISAASDRLSLEASELEKRIEDQRNLLKTITDAASGQLKEVQSALALGTDDLQEALEKAVSRAKETADQFRDEADAASSHGIEAASHIEKAAETAQRIAEQARESLDKEAEKARAAIESQAHYVKELFQGLSKSSQDAFAAKATALREALEGEAETFNKMLEETNRTTETTLKGQLSGSVDLIEKTAGAVTAAGKTLSDAVERLDAVGSQSRETISASTSQLQSFVKQLPSQAQGAAAEIQDVLDQHLNAIDALVDESARKLQKLSSAYERHLPGTYRVAQETAANELSSTERQNELAELAAEFSKRRRARPPERHQSKDHPMTADRSDWGWRELLSSLDRTDTRAEEPGIAQPSLDSLSVIEALHSMAIDIDRAIEMQPPSDLLRRFLNGERGLFIKRLLEIASPELTARIHDKYLEDLDFRNHVNEYIETFEGVLSQAMDQDKADLLLDTFLGSQTGKVYLLLGTSVGHFSGGDR